MPSGLFSKIWRYLGIKVQSATCFLGPVANARSLVVQLVKNPPHWGRPEFSPWVSKIPWRMERPALQYSGLENFVGSQRVRHDWTAFTSLHHVQLARVPGSNSRGCHSPPSLHAWSHCHCASSPCSIVLIHGSPGEKMSMCVCVCVCVCLCFYFVLFFGVRLWPKSLQLYLTLCDPMDCSPPGSSVHGILQARMLEWVAMPPGELPEPELKPTSLVSCLGR